MRAAVHAATMQLSLSMGQIQFSGADNNTAKHVDRLHFEMSYYGNSTIRVHGLESSACVNTNRVAVNSCSNYHLTVRMFRVGLQGSDCSLQWTEQQIRTFPRKPDGFQSTHLGPFAPVYSKNRVKLEAFNSPPVINFYTHYMKKLTTYELMSEACYFRYIFILSKSWAGNYVEDEKVLKPCTKHSKETTVA